MSTPILEVSNLTKFFPIQSQGIFSKVKGDNKAVNGISFTLNAGETLGSLVNLAVENRQLEEQFLNFMSQLQERLNLRAKI